MSSKGRAERYELDKIRNIGVMAHIDAGKTTLTERILFYTGVSYKLGEVDEGTATMDWMEQEQERGITITAAATTCYWRSHQINLIDTPGHVDFTVEVERCLRVLDGAIAVFSAVEGVEPQSETVWRQADKYGVARVAFINKCDRSGADPEACVRQMSTKLGCRPLVLQLAVGLESEFRGVVDLIARRLLEWSEDDEGVRVRASDVPAALTDAVDAARAQLLEQLAEVDDPMLEAFANGVQPSEREIHDSIRRVTLARLGVPVLLGAAFRNKGVQPLLDAVVDYLPAPVDLPPCQATDLHGRPVTRGPDPAGPLAALAFKVVHDPHAGQLTYVRVYSGTLRTGESVLNSVRGGSERVQRLLRMHANKREQIKNLRAGDLAAVTGWQETATGDTACDAAAPVLLEKMAFPVPTMQVAIYPVDRMNREKLAAALGRLSREDPSIGVTVRSETGETLVSGMGELHLEILVDRLKREFRIDATIGRPRVAYRETVRHAASGEGKYMHHSMGKAQYAHVKLGLAAAPRGAGVSFGAAPTCGIPDEYIPAIDRGARALLEKGVLAGFPLIDVKVELEGGSHNDVDSTVIAFQIAAALATFEAAQRAVPCLLEPILQLEAETPEEFTGTVVSDLSQRRGRVTGVERRGSAEVVRAEVPVSTMFGYASDLRSLTQGRASFVSGFCRYSEVPSSDVAGLIAQLGSDAQEDRCSRAAS